MLFLIHGVDKEGCAELREKNKRAHRNHVALFKRNVQFAGPTLTEDGNAKTGSVLLVDFPDRGGVEGFVNRDPYVKAGLFESVTIQSCRKIQGVGS